MSIMVSLRGKPFPATRGILGPHVNGYSIFLSVLISSWILNIGQRSEFGKYILVQRLASQVISQWSSFCVRFLGDSNWIIRWEPLRSKNAPVLQVLPKRTGLLSLKPLPKSNLKSWSLDMKGTRYYPPAPICPYCGPDLQGCGSHREPWSVQPSQRKWICLTRPLFFLEIHLACSLSQLLYLP